MKVAVCGLTCKQTFEVKDDDYDVKVIVMVPDPKVEDGFREQMTFGCALCQQSATDQRDLLETSAAAVTAADERDRYKALYEQSEKERTAQFTDLSQARVDIVRIEGELDATRADLDKMTA